MTPIAAFTRSWWKAGSMIRRDCLWKSPSIVSIPSPSSGIRSPKPPSRQRKRSALETSMKWFASGPSMKTLRALRMRSENTGPWRS